MDETSSNAASEIAATFSTEAEPVEAVTTEQTKEHSSTDDGFDRKFAALSRKDKEFRDEQASWQEEKAELEALRSEKAAKASESDAPQMSIEQRLKRDPLGTLKDLGLSYDKLTELALNDGKLDSESLMNNKLDDMNSKWEETYGSKIKQLEEQIAEKEAAEITGKQEQAVEGFKDNINAHLTENEADFELISAYKANDLVFDVIETHYNETNRVLEISDACKAVEEHLLTEYQKLSKIEKLQAKQEAKPSLFTESPTTLSNAQSAQASTSTERKLSVEESKANAASLIRWD